MRTLYHYYFWNMSIIQYSISLGGLYRVYKSLPSTFHGQKYSWYERYVAFAWLRLQYRYFVPSSYHEFPSTYHECNLMVIFHSCLYVYQRVNLMVQSPCRNTTDSKVPALVHDAQASKLVPQNIVHQKSVLISGVHKKSSSPIWSNLIRCVFPNA